MNSLFALNLLIAAGMAEPNAAFQVAGQEVQEPAALELEAPLEAIDLTAPPETLPAVDSDASSQDETISQPEEPSGPLVFEGKTDEEITAMVVEHLENIATLQGKFYQQAPSGTLSTGTFHIRRPGLLRFTYDPPTELLIVANGGTVFVRDEALQTTDSYPVRKTPLKFLLRRKIDFDKADIVSIERGVDAIAITLSSRDEDTEGELTLVFSAPDLGLIRWVVRDARNGMTIVDLIDVERDVTIANSVFRIPETKSPFLVD